MILADTKPIVIFEPPSSSTRGDKAMIVTVYAHKQKLMDVKKKEVSKNSRKQTNKKTHQKERTKIYQKRKVKGRNF